VISKIMLRPVFILTALSCVWSVTRLIIYSMRFYNLRKKPEPERGENDNRIEYLRIRIRESLQLTIVFSLGLLMCYISSKMTIVLLFGFVIIIIFLRRKQ
jgi:4-hydroxybenzoate polyprenyltransferase